MHRPAVFFLSDGQPNDDSDWLEPRERLTDKTITPAAPNIIAFGIGDVMAETILQVATDEEVRFRGHARVRTSAPQSPNSSSRLRIASCSPARSLTSPNPELVVEKPEGFRMAIDIV